MCTILSILSAIFAWLRANEQSLAIWLEGIALVAIFFLELKEYRRQGQERIEQHKELADQMAIAKKAADAAHLSAQAVLNSERAWIEIKLGPPERNDDDLPVWGEDNRVLDLFECSIQIENHGRTIARIESVQVGAETVSGPLPQEPSNLTTRNLHSVLGSGQKVTVCGFNADTGFSDGASIVNGTKRGILRIIARYRDVVQTSELHETSVVYVFQNSLEDEPEKISSLSVYT
ncbi:MAG: hypothetical protein WBL50_17955 [Candidatus Acidiferrum sp.]